MITQTGTTRNCNSLRQVPFFTIFLSENRSSQGASSPVVLLQVSEDQCLPIFVGTLLFLKSPHGAMVAAHGSPWRHGQSLGRHCWPGEGSTPAPWSTKPWVLIDLIVLVGQVWVYVSELF